MVSYKSPSPLNDDTWHSVHVEMNQNQAWMKIDDYAGNATSEDPGLIHQLDLTSPLTVGELLNLGLVDGMSTLIQYKFHRLCSINFTDEGPFV